MRIIATYKIPIILTITGVLGGIAYWFFIGCNGGTCPITSNWYSSALYGGVFGLLISDFRKKDKNQNKNE